MRIAYHAAAGAVFAASLAPAGYTGGMTFNEVPLGTLADGLTIDNVTFSTSDPTAQVGHGPGNTTFTVGAGLGGSTHGGPLHLTFATAVRELRYSFAIGSTSKVADASTIELFGQHGQSLGAFSTDASPGFFMFASGRRAFDGLGPIRSASVTFDSAASSQFILDNLVYTAVPSPAATTMFLCAAACRGSRRRR